MSEITKKKIVEYLASHRYLRLATVNPEGNPCTHTVRFVSEGSAVYFMSAKGTSKIQNILRRPRVAFNVDENYEDLNRIQGIQMKEIAEVIEDKEEEEKCRRMLRERFPQLRDILPVLEMAVVRITPVEANFLDNTVEFGYAERVVFN